MFATVSPVAAVAASPPVDATGAALEAAGAAGGAAGVGAGTEVAGGTRFNLLTTAEY